jgi:hypothetical protein
MLSLTRPIVGLEAEVAVAEEEVVVDLLPHAL